MGFSAISGFRHPLRVLGHIPVGKAALLNVAFGRMDKGKLDDSSKVVFNLYDFLKFLFIDLRKRNVDLLFCLL